MVEVITVEAIAVAKDKPYLRQMTLKRPNVWQRGLSGLIFWLQKPEWGFGVAGEASGAQLSGHLMVTGNRGSLIAKKLAYVCGAQVSLRFSWGFTWIGC